MTNAAAASFFSALAEEVENHYANSFLVPLNDSWYQAVEKEDRWRATNTAQQSGFYERYVAPLVNKGIKVCVIISDGLRFEVGAELASRIESLDRHSDCSRANVRLCCLLYTK